MRQKETTQTCQLAQLPTSLYYKNPQFLHAHSSLAYSFKSPHHPARLHLLLQPSQFLHFHHPREHLSFDMFLRRSGLRWLHRFLGSLRRRHRSSHYKRRRGQIELHGLGIRKLCTFKGGWTRLLRIRTVDVRLECLTTHLAC